MDQFQCRCSRVVAFALIFAKNTPDNTTNQLLNVSYDPTRELYQKLNTEFVAEYEKRTGRHITVDLGK
jgi:sulfate/thiosulfate transport system substrate-binding protein